MKQAFADWTQFLAWLDGLGMFHMELDPGRMRKALALTGMEKPPFPVIQVAGTNGKGSTSTFLASLGKEHGLKTALFTSPHFLSPRERILIDGRMLPEKQWLGQANFLYSRLSESLHPTYFEFLTLLALALFDEAKVRLAVFEAGLGGANDATSVLPAAICCFTPVAMDHAAIIGPDIQAIARDKAAAMTGKEIAFSAPQFPKVAEVLQGHAASLKIPLHFTPPLRNIPARDISLHGAHQAENAALALAAWRHLAKRLDITPDPGLEKKALKNAFIAGRMQFIPRGPAHPALMLDGAHNPHAMNLLARQLPPACCLIYSALADKDWPNTLKILCRACEAPLFVPQIANSRAARAKDIADYCNRLHPGRAMAVQGPYSMLKALGHAAEMAASSEGSVIICGSLFLLAAFYQLFPQYLYKNGEEHDNAIWP